MKKAKNLTVGTVVSVPDYCFAPLRHGWNGWIFRAGIIRSVKISKKTGKTIYQVERCVRGYDHLNRKPTFTKWFYAENIFEFSMTHTNMLMEYSREYWGGSYDEGTEFLIDNGKIEYPYKKAME